MENKDNLVTIHIAHVGHLARDLNRCTHCPVRAGKRKVGEAEAVSEEKSVYANADMCPECGTISLIRAEGCKKCLTCGYSEC